MREEELSYLRDEMNQKLTSFRENTNQTLKHVLLMWGGALALFGVAKELSENTQNMIITVIIFGVFFLSNTLIYFAVKKDFRSIETICRLASYIIVFYERKFIADKKDEHIEKEDYIFWEIANIEIEAAENKKLEKNLGYRDIMIKEFTIMAGISTILILLYSIYLFSIISLKEQSLYGLIMPFIYFIALCISIRQIYIIFRNVLSLRGIYKREKIKWLRVYLDYAINIGYYSRMAVKDRFGEYFLGIIGYEMPSEKTGKAMCL
jgi:hypothetical protein